MARNIGSLKRSLLQKAKTVNLFGRSIISITQFSRGQIDRLFSLAESLEPYQHTGIELLDNSVMATIFFEPSTRTRLSFETAMHRLGGSVISEATPLISSSVAKEESLEDMLRVLSDYANIIVLRHPDSEKAETATQSLSVPVISGGFGDKEHPTQTLLDLYTIYRIMGKVDGTDVTIASPDLQKARTAHSLALALAKYDANVTFVSPAKSAIPEYVIASLGHQDSKVKQVLDPSPQEYATIVGSSDIVYLPGCRVSQGDQSREAFKESNRKYFISLDMLRKAKDDGKLVYVMHSLPRFPGEMDLRIDFTPHALYFRQSAYGVVIRMATLLSVAS